MRRVPVRPWAMSLIRLDVLELLVQVGFDGEDFGGPGHVPLPRVGKDQPFAHPVKEPQPQGCLQLLQKLGKGGLGEVEGVCRLGDALVPRNGKNIGHLLKIHKIRPPFDGIHPTQPGGQSQAKAGKIIVYSYYLNKKYEFDAIIPLCYYGNEQKNSRTNRKIINSVDMELLHKFITEKDGKP